MDEQLGVHFAVLVDSLRGYQQGFIDSSFRATSIVLLVLGWLLTSKEARAYLASDGRARRIAAAALGLGAVVYAAISWRAYSLSQAVFDRLVALDFAPIGAYADQRIGLATFVTFVAQNAILTGVTCYLMLNTRAPALVHPPVTT